MVSVPEIKLNNDTTIPQLGLGVFKMKEEDKLLDAFQWALDIGYRHFDTAAIYGNEKWLGEAIKKSGIDRKEIFVTSKLWPSDFSDPKKAYEESCERLGLDYLDLYLIHWPAPGFVEAWQAMEKFYQNNQVKAIGVSNFLQKHLESLFENSDVVPAVDQIELHPYLQRPQLTDYLKEKGIAIEAWGPLGQGNRSMFEEPILKNIAQETSKSVAQVILRWHIQSGHIIFPKSTHKQRLQENYDILDFSLSDEQMKQIATLDKNQPNGSDPADQSYLDSTKDTHPQN